MGWEAGVSVDTLWATVPGGGSVANSGPIADGLEATNANDSHFNWTIENPELAEFQNGTRRSHQCMLVELSSPSGLSFVNNSVHRNLDFKQASRFTESAQISLKSLPPIAPDGRDVYVWVETLNMPKVVTPNGKPRDLRTTIPARPTGPAGGPPGTENQPQVSEPSEGKPIPVPSLERLLAMLAAGEVTPSQIEEVVPTYIVHVYHDTGKKLRLGGSDRPVLTPQGAFGYYVLHQGSLYGWEHQLVGEGFTLEQLAPDFYRIKKVPNDGVVRVSTTITALETKPGTLLGIPWWVWILLLLILILLLIVWIRR
jgi:hypothetical protein